MELFAIALRNVFRNPRRTALNMVAIGLGVMIILTMKGWVAGFGASAYQTTVDLDTAHVQVIQKDYQDEARRLPLDLRIKDWPGIKAALAGLPGLVGVGARLDFGAALSNGQTSLNVSVRGVDPEGEAQTNTIKSQIREGSYFTEENQVLLGSGLAKKLGLKVGDQVFLTALDQYGVRNLVDGSVGGIFTSGYGIFDDGVAGIVDLADVVGKGVFAVWRDPLVFEQVRIGSCGELVWGEQVDLCPDALYLKVTGKQPEDLFPTLRNDLTHA